MTQRALLVIGHGSRERVDEFHKVCDMLRSKGGFDLVQPAFLELSEPDISGGVEMCVAAGAREIVAVPLFFARGGHVKNEIPALLRRAALRHPGLPVRFGEPLGLHDSIAAILRERVAEAAPDGETALLLVGRGSSDPDARQALRETQAVLRRGHPRVFEAYMDVLRPSLEEGLEKAIASGARRVAVVPCLLFHGTLTRRIEEAAALVRGVEISIAPPLGPEPRLAEVLLQRAREARPLPPRMLMVVGTSSHAGKSLLVAGICRLLARRGFRVAPFKAQNMSLNSGVVPLGTSGTEGAASPTGGGELARAQMLQAQAARAEPRVEMNPILLKPTGVGRRSQVVLLGRPWATLEAPEYYSYRPVWEAVAVESLRRLGEASDLIVMEGAGSPAEPNLRGLDFTNLSLAARAGADALLVADIERGGAFASVVGTLALLPSEERARVKGVVLNKFRGDPSLLEPAIQDLEARTGIPVLGVVDHLDNLGLDPEDSITLEERAPPAPAKELAVAVVRLPRISNFTDFDALRGEPGVHLRYVTRPEDLGGSDAILLPGSKGTPSELEAIEENGMAQALRGLAGRIPIAGLCGGYQMLGHHISDPHGADGAPRRVPGLGLLDVTTTYAPRKVTTPVRAEPHPPNGGPGTASQFLHPSPRDGWTIEGYEIHMGRTTRGPGAQPLFHVIERDGRPADDPEGATTPDGMVWGTYIHGVFDAPRFRRTFLNRLRNRRGLPPLHLDGPHRRETRLHALQRLAEAMEHHLDMERIWKLTEEP